MRVGRIYDRESALDGIFNNIFFQFRKIFKNRFFNISTNRKLLFFHFCHTNSKAGHKRHVKLKCFEILVTYTIGYLHH